MPFTTEPRQDRLIEGLFLTLQTDLDLAFYHLRLAEAEARGGKAAHAWELIAKAAIAHKTVTQALAGISDFYENKRELAQEARRLLESVQSVERQFRVL
jgi:hypothetical protein